MYLIGSILPMDSFQAGLLKSFSFFLKQMSKIHFCYRKVIAESARKGTNFPTFAENWNLCTAWITKWPPAPATAKANSSCFLPSRWCRTARRSLVARRALLWSSRNDSFAKGEEAAGHQVEFISLRKQVWLTLLRDETMCRCKGFRAFAAAFVFCVARKTVLLQPFSDKATWQLYHTH